MLIYTSTKIRAYGRHSAFAPFFASTWLHSLRYAEVSIGECQELIERCPIAQQHRRTDHLFAVVAVHPGHAQY